MTEQFVNQVASSYCDIIYLQQRGKKNLVAGLALSHAWVHFYIVFCWLLVSLKHSAATKRKPLKLTLFNYKKLYDIHLQ